MSQYDGTWTVDLYNSLLVSPKMSIVEARRLRRYAVWKLWWGCCQASDVV